MDKDADMLLGVSQRAVKPKTTNQPTNLIMDEDANTNIYPDKDVLV